MAETTRKYKQPAVWTHQAVEQALQADDSAALLQAVIGVAMYDADWQYAQSLCIRLSAHPHFNVRGNAVLGFGHIARVHGHLDRVLVQPIIVAALQERDDYVRGQSFAAADDTAHFLGWRYPSIDLAQKQP